MKDRKVQREKKRAEIMQLIKPAEEVELKSERNQRKVVRENITRARNRANMKNYFEQLKSFRSEVAEILNSFEPKFDSLKRPNSTMLQVFFEECCKSKGYCVPPAELGPKALGLWKKWYDLWSMDKEFNAYNIIYFIVSNWKDIRKKHKAVAWSPNPIQPIIVDNNRMTTFMGLYGENKGASDDWF